MPLLGDLLGQAFAIILGVLLAAFVTSPIWIWIYIWLLPT